MIQQLKNSFPLVHAQKRILLIERLFENTPIHNLAGHTVYNGEINFEILRQAVHIFVKNYEAIRIRFYQNEAYEIVQYITEFEELDIKYIDFSKQKNSEKAFKSWAQEEALQEMNWENSSLVKFIFFKIAPEKTGFFTCLHHAIADGWSIHLMIDFISKTYAQIQEKKTVFNENQQGFFEYVKEEQAYFSSSDFSEDEVFWKQQIHKLPKSFKIKVQTTTKSKQKVYKLSTEIQQQLKEISVHYKVSIPSLLTALVVLQRLLVTSHKIISIGMPIYNRRGRFKSTFGMMTAIVPLFFQVEETLNIHDFFKKVVRTLRTNMRHLKYPYELILKEFQKINPETNGVFNFCVNYYNTKMDTSVRLEGHSVKIQEHFVGHQIFPIYLVVKEWEENGTMDFVFNYKIDHYTESDILEIYNSIIEFIDAIHKGNKETIGELLALHQKKQSLNKMVINDISSHKNETIVFGTFPKKVTQAVTGKHKKQKLLQIPLENYTSFYAIEEKFNAKAATVLIAIILDLLKRYSGNNKQGVTYYSSINKRYTIGHEFTDTTSICTLFEKVSQSLEAQKLNPTIETAEVLCRLKLNNSEDFIEEYQGIQFELEAYEKQVYLNCRFNDDWYDHAMVGVIMNQFLRCLNNYQAIQERPLSEIYFLSEKEKDTILNVFNDTHIGLPEELSILDAFDKFVVQTPEKIAIKFGEERLTYKQLNKKVEKLAALLLTKGIQQNEIVALLAERSIELIVGVFAIIKAGGAYLPVDNSLPSKRIEFILKDSKAQLLLTHNSNYKAAIETIYLGNPEIYNHTFKYEKPYRKNTDLAYVIYTSGSTGTPKGVLVNHLALLNRIQWKQRAYPIGKQDVLLQKTSISFDVSVWELFWWSMTGASLYLLEPKNESDPETLNRIIKEENITVVHFVPPMLKGFLTYIEAEEKEYCLSNLKFVFASGEALQEETVNRFNKLRIPTQLVNLYGPTEAAIDVSYHNVPKHTVCKKVPIGRPIDNMALYVMDSKMRVLPVGMPGELCIEGIGLAQGYLNRNKLNAEKFVKGAPKSNGNIYKTGDLARWLPNGELEYLGRIDSQVKLRGYRIELSEIEIALMKHSSVKDAIVLINNKAQLIGYVQLYNQVREEELTNNITGWLPQYMVPHKLLFVEEFPLLANGKIDRKKLSNLAIQRSHEGFVAPKTENEKMLTKIWQEVLHLEKIGVNDNFFSLGGDSIKFVTLLVKARKKGISFTYQELFQYPTIKGLLSSAELGEREKVMITVKSFELLPKLDIDQIPENIEDAYPLSMLQAGLLYQSEIQKGTALYFDVFSYKITGAFNQELFEKAVGAMVLEHPIIRTTYHLSGYSQYIQMVHKSIPLPLQVINISNISASEQEENLATYVKYLQNKEVNFEEPGIIGFHIHILSNHEYIYTVGFHDSALDGWSVNLLHTLLFEKYHNLLQGNDVSSKRLETKFSDFIKLELQSLNDTTASKFWKHYLKDYIFTKIPRWEEVYEKETIKLGYYNVDLPKELSNNVKQLASDLNVPIKTILLAAHCNVLSIISGNNNVVTGYEISGRPEEEDGEKVLGLFLNTIPFRSHYTDKSWRSFITEIYQSELAVLPHRRFPMANIKREIGGANPLFETVFNYTHFHVLKRLQELEDFNITDVEMEAETEFVLRAEFSLHPFNDHLLFWLHYHANEFSLTEIERIGGYYVKTLELMIENVDGGVRAVSLLTDDERNKQIFEFNDNEVIYPSEKTFNDLFRHQVTQLPDNYAVTYQNVRWTYRQLNEKSNKLANQLLSLGIQKGTPVAVSMDRTNYWMAAVISIMKAGAVYVPMDTEWPLNRSLKIINKIATRWVITDSENESKLASECGIHLLNVQECIDRTEISTKNPDLVISLDDLAYIIFTSGSTGEPKGVMIEHKGMLNHLYAKINDLDLKQTDVIAQNSSQCFDISVWQLIAGVLVGAETIIYENELILELQKFCDKIEENKVTILEFVPSYMEMILHTTKLKSISFSSIRYLLLTGEPLKIGLVNAWFNVYTIPLVNAYGPTEASDDITHHFMYGPLKGTQVPVGKTIQNLNIYVLDDFGHMTPLGTKGNVFVSGIGVGKGYIGNNEKTAAVFSWDYILGSTERRMYKTGDLGRWTKGGVLQLYGREDDQIKLNGHRIDLGEIESLLQRHEQVRNVAVVFKSDKKELIAFLVCDTDDEEGLTAYLRGVLPKYMVPNSFKMLAELPQTPNGKIDKKKLLQISHDIPKNKAFIEAISETNQLKLAKLWSKVLEIDIETIHANSNFYSLGGHSLKAMQLSIQSGRSISINDVLKYPVLKDMAEKVHVNKELLVSFNTTDEVTNNTISFIGCSYAGGSAANFIPLFDEIKTQQLGMDCYGLEYPKEDHYNIKQKAAEYAAIIISKIKTAIVVWGHCSGAAMAIELVRILEARNVEVIKLFIGGKILKNRFETKSYAILRSIVAPFIPVDASKMTNQQIKNWLINKSGFTEMENLAVEESEYISNAFRLDSIAANNYLKDIILVESHKINTAIVNVIANDDPLTSGYESKFTNWNLISENTIELETLEYGGHYFIKSRIKSLVNLLNNSLSIPCKIVKTNSN